MLKTVLAGATALAIAGTSLAFAQQPDAQRGAQQHNAQDQNAAAPGQQRRERNRLRMSAEDVSAYADARIAGMKAGLRLTPEQEKNWPAVEAAIRDFAKQRADRMNERRDQARTKREAQDRPDMIERLRSRADAMSRRAADLKRFADVSAPLYQSLDEAQKRRLGPLMRQTMRQGGGTHRGGR